MQAREYVAVRSVEAAVDALSKSQGSGRVLAGGTDLIVQVRENRRDVGVMIDIKRVPEMSLIELGSDGSLRLGAAVPCYAVYEDAAVKAAYPALVDSASLIGGTQVQSRATIGGNLSNSSPAADSIPTLIALNAVAVAAGPNGTRAIPVDQFCSGPGRNVLAADEVLVELRFPAPANHGALTGARFLRFIPRNEMDIAVANAAVSLTLDEGGRTIRSARVAVGAVAPTPLLVAAAGESLAGQPVSPEAFERAVTAVREAVSPITDMRGSAHQRRHLIGVLVRRALEGAVERALR